jgi:hypothetical protein
VVTGIAGALLVPLNGEGEPLAGIIHKHPHAPTAKVTRRQSRQ